MSNPDWIAHDEISAWSPKQIDRLLSDIALAPVLDALENPNHDCDPGDCTDAND